MNPTWSTISLSDQRKEKPKASSADSCFFLLSFHIYIIHTRVYCWNTILLPEPNLFFLLIWPFSYNIQMLPTYIPPLLPFLKTWHHLTCRSSDLSQQTVLVYFWQSRWGNPTWRQTEKREKQQQWEKLKERLIDEPPNLLACVMLCMVTY